MDQPYDKALNVVVESRVCNLFTGEWSEWAHFHTFQHRKAVSAARTRNVYQAKSRPDASVQYRIVD